MGSSRAGRVRRCDGGAGGAVDAAEGAEVALAEAEHEGVGAVGFGAEFEVESAFGAFAGGGAEALVEGVELGPHVVGEDGFEAEAGGVAGGGVGAEVGGRGGVADGGGRRWGGVGVGGVGVEGVGVGGVGVGAGVGGVVVDLAGGGEE
jgi:hypothetical protein